MDDIKIENFTREHPGSLFPAFRTLTAQENELIRNSIATRLGLPLQTTPLDLVRSVRERAEVIPNISAEGDDFNLKNLIAELGIEDTGEIRINWYRFDNVDGISLNNLSHYFDDIWYPAADEIDLFDNTLEWILSIDYSGNVGFLKF